jgi:hypothetical protein
MNKYIFLDVDGVLNHELFYIEKHQHIRHKEHEDKGEEYDLGDIDEEKIKLLNNLIKDTGAKVIISSCWRLGRHSNDMQKFLEKKGFKGEIIGSTPRLYFQERKNYSYSVPRGCEIKAWLEMNKDKHGDKISKVKYVILDDDSDMLLWQREQYFRVDPYCGLTHNITYRATQYLNSED